MSIKLSISIFQSIFQDATLRQITLLAAAQIQIGYSLAVDNYVKLANGIDNVDNAIHHSNTSVNTSRC